MKKALTIILALALVMSLSVPVFAANPTDSRTDLSFILETAQPTYTVTIPGSLKLEIGDNVLPITVSDAVNLGGNNVVVTFEGTQYGTPVVKYALMLQFNDSITNAVYYKIFDMNDIDLQHGDGYTVPVAPGIALASFAGNGSAKIRINVPDQTGWAYPNVLYTGYITFGIKLEGSINASVSTIAPGTVQFVIDKSLNDDLQLRASFYRAVDNGIIDIMSMSYSNDNKTVIFNVPGVSTKGAQYILVFDSNAKYLDGSAFGPATFRFVADWE